MTRIRDSGDNWLRWVSLKGAHHESWIFRVNHRTHGSGLWVRWSIDATAPETATAGVSVLYFDPHVAARWNCAHISSPMSALASELDPFSIALGGCVLTDNACRGELTLPPSPTRPKAQPIRWNFTFNPSTFSHHPFPVALEHSGLPPTKMVTPQAVLLINGKLSVGDTSLEFREEPGSQSHVWGRRHPQRWSWAHCNSFREDATACLETITLEHRYRGFRLPAVTWPSLYLGGEVYRFTELLRLPQTRETLGNRSYAFAAAGDLAKIDGEVTCSEEQQYSWEGKDTDGSLLIHQVSQVADVVVRIWTRPSSGGRFRQSAQLTAQRSGCLHQVSHTYPE